MTREGLLRGLVSRGPCRHLVVAALMAVSTCASLSFAEGVPAETRDVLTRDRTPVREVTVFSDRAQVVRTASLSLDPGTHIVVFDELPYDTFTNSLQAKGKGSGSLKEAKIVRRVIAEITDEQVRGLTQEKEKLEQKARELEDRNQAIAAQRELLSSIVTRALTVPPKASESKVNVEDYGQLLRFQREQQDMLAAEERSVQQEKLALQRQRQEIDSRISQAGARGQRQKLSAEVTLDVTEKGRVEIDLSYIVPGPSWQPVYDLRVDSEKSTLQLGYGALVRQSTSEDWDQATLLLSTAVPQAGGAHPELSPWHIGIAAARPMRRDQRAKGEVDEEAQMSQLFGSAKDGAPASAPAPLAEMPVARAVVRGNATSVAFEVPGKRSIANDGQQHRVPILLRELPVHLRYSAVPKLSPAAYLKARATNGTDYPLLPGQSNIFLDGNFVAEGSLDLVAPGAEFWTFLGSDSQIAVEHKQVKRFVEEGGIINKTQRVTYEYQLKVKNNKRQKVELVLWDQVPISDNEKVVVTMIEPSYSKDTDSLKKNEQNFLEWLLNLDPGEEKKIPLKFSVEYPATEPVFGVY